MFTKTRKKLRKGSKQHNYGKLISQSDLQCITSVGLKTGISYWLLAAIHRFRTMIHVGNVW
jgi:hypothetical protein